jgi:hypothetical protein
MRYRLRTLLILLAIGPPIVAIGMMRHLDNIYATHQLKERNTRKSLYSAQERMEVFLRKSHVIPPNEDQIMREWEKDIDVACGRSAQDGWGRTLVVEWRDDHNELYARSCGPNGRNDGGTGDDVEVSCLIPIYLRNGQKIISAVVTG